MEFNFQTKIVDVSVALNALNLYREGNYKQAILQLMQVLDSEPNNWQGRLMLAACYYKCDEFGSAQRAFQFIFDKCPDLELKEKSRQALEACRQKLCKTATNIPAEFGCHAEFRTDISKLTWLDESPTKKPTGSQQKWTGPLVSLGSLLRAMGAS